MIYRIGARTYKNAHFESLVAFSCPTICIVNEEDNLIVVIICIGYTLLAVYSFSCIGGGLYVSILLYITKQKE